MYNPQVLERALAELNMKYERVLGMTNEDDEAAYKAIEADLKRIEEYCGKPVRYDNNYTCTWGIYRYGLYGSLSAYQEVAELVDAGITF
jgi:hypothetical protein